MAHHRKFIVKVRFMLIKTHVFHKPEKNDLPVFVQNIVILHLTHFLGCKHVHAPHVTLSQKNDHNFSNTQQVCQGVHEVVKFHIWLPIRKKNQNHRKNSKWFSNNNFVSGAFNAL